MLQALHNQQNGNVEGEDVEVAGTQDDHHEEHSFGDVMIHQVKRDKIFQK